MAQSSFDRQVTHYTYIVMDLDVLTDFAQLVIHPTEWTFVVRLENLNKYIKTTHIWPFIIVNIRVSSV